MNSWPTKKLGEICEIKIGKTPRRGVVKYWVNGTLPWATISEVRGNEIVDTNEQITTTAVKELNMAPFPKGTILYTFKLSIGRVGTAGVDLFTNEAIAGLLIKDKKNLTPEWLFYILPLIDYRPFLSNAVKGNTLNKSSLNLLLIPLPPLQIQKQIVQRMDKIVEARKLNDELIQKSEELFQSLLHKELDPTSKSWGVKKLGEVAEIIMGQSPPSSTYNEKGEGLPFFQGKAEYGEIYPTPIKYCPKPTRIAEAGDILMSVRAPVGNINLAREKSGIGRGLGAIRARKGVEQSFLYFFFIKNESNWSRLSVGSTFSAIRRNNLDNLEVPIPPLETQKQIVAKLSAAQEYKRQLLEQKAKLKELFDSVLHKSMSGEMN